MLFGTIILLLATGQIFLVYKRDVISKNLAAISENLAAISEKIQGSPLHLSLYFFSFYSFKRKGRGEKMLEKGKNFIKMVKMFYKNSVNFYSGEIYAPSSSSSKQNCFKGRRQRRANRRTDCSTGILVPCTVVRCLFTTLSAKEACLF